MDKILDVNTREFEVSRFVDGGLGVNISSGR